jgi:two-component system phosphate regulon sensor histidine kinase PhoR
VRKAWLEESLHLAGVSLAGILVGVVFDRVLVFFCLGLAGYAAWHLLNIWRLARWLGEGKTSPPPESRGIWADIFDDIYRLQQRDRKRKKKLGSMLRRFQNATAAIPYAMVVLKSSDEIEWWNDAATQLLGLRYPQDAGQRIGNLIRNLDFVARLGRDADATPFDLISPRDHQALLSVQIVPYGKNQRLVVARDVTRFRSLEQMRRDFVANVSHELRTPLTVLLGYLEPMADDAASLHESWRAQIGVMREQAERMHRIIDDLLTLARLESRNEIESSQPVCVAAMLESVREDAERLSGEEAHRISLAADADLWLDGNSEELRSLFSNLAFNAVRYTPPGGKIDMRWYADDSGAHFEIRDTGIGIPARCLSRVTERFYRVDTSRSRQRGGTGLGLAIVKHVLLRHGGSLHVESVPGRGTVFRCDYPASRILREHVKVEA